MDGVGIIQHLIAGRLRRCEDACFGLPDIAQSSLRGLPSERPELSILVPVYNERETVLRVLEKVGEVDFSASTEIIVVDDGSTDGTADMLRRMPPRADLRVIFHARNTGKGGAIQTALRHARGRMVVIQDADDELDPADLLPLFERVRNGKDPVCYGTRFAAGSSRPRWMPTYWANRILNGICNWMNGLNLTDMNTCYKMMPTDLARRLGLVSQGFEMELEITTKLARMGVDIVEEPISYCPRSKAAGKKIRFSDGFHYLLAMIRFRFWRPTTPSTRVQPVLAGGPMLENTARNLGGVGFNGRCGTAGIVVAPDFDDDLPIRPVNQPAPRSSNQ